VRGCGHRELSLHRNNNQLIKHIDKLRHDL